MLRCDYEPGFVAPEMVKRRPVIVVSPRLRNRDGLCTVVPLSTTAPPRVMPYHYKILFDPPLPYPYDAREHWVKADMLATVGFHRLLFLQMARDQYGKRKNDVRIISSADLEAIRLCILSALGIVLPRQESIAPAPTARTAPVHG